MRARLESKKTNSLLIAVSWPTKDCEEASGDGIESFICGQTVVLSNYEFWVEMSEEKNTLSEFSIAVVSIGQFKYSIKLLSQMLY